MQFPRGINLCILPHLHLTHIPSVYLYCICICVFVYFTSSTFDICTYCISVYLYCMSHVTCHMYLQYQNLWLYTGITRLVFWFSLNVERMEWGGKEGFLALNAKFGFTLHCGQVAEPAGSISFIWKPPRKSDLQISKKCQNLHLLTITCVLFILISNRNV